MGESQLLFKGCNLMLMELADIWLYVMAQTFSPFKNLERNGWWEFEERNWGCPNIRLKRTIGVIRVAWTWSEVRRDSRKERPLTVALRELLWHKAYNHIIIRRIIKSSILCSFAHYLHQFIISYHSVFFVQHIHNHHQYHIIVKSSSERLNSNTLHLRTLRECDYRAAVHRKLI